MSVRRVLVAVLIALVLVHSVFSHAQHNGRQGQREVRRQDCGQSNVTLNGFVSGRESKIGAWPWLVALFLQDGGVKTRECGGALISARHVVTAAQCVAGLNGEKLLANDITVRLGDHDLDSSDDQTEPVDIGVTRIIMHPQYDRTTFHNDIAILVLKDEVHFNKFVQPICLAYDPPMLTDNYEGKEAFVAGWGAIDFGSPPSSKMREVSFPIWNQASCRMAYRHSVLVNDDFVCAGLVDGGPDACQGYSGSPLMLTGGPESRFYLIGILSFGKKCGLPNFPGVYTNVRNYLEWIKEKTT